MTYEMDNPWAVTHIDSFNFLCCPECAFRSKEISSFQSHAVENHPKSKVFFSEKQRETQEIEANLFYCCPECIYKSEDVNMFQIHALENHPSTSLAFFSRDDSNDGQNIGQNTDTGNPWEKDNVEEFSFFCCSDCPFRTKESANYELHIAEEHLKTEKSVNNVIELSKIKSEVEYDYEEMDYENDYGNDYDTEMKVEDLKTEDTEEKYSPKVSKSGTKVSTCGVCSQEFNSVKELKKHNGHNKDNKIFNCSLCSKNFCRKKSLMEHNRTIHANIQCDVCSMIFDNPAKLNKHKRRKHPTPEKCEICGTNQMNLKRHITNIHSNVKPWKCDRPGCSFSANQKCNLDVHKERCQEKKDYTCELCKRVFPKSNKHYESQYIKHYKAEHNDIPPEFKDKKQYLCSECPESFFNKNVFNAHVWSNHTNSSANSNPQNLMKKFECKTCQTTIFGRKNYVAHCKDVHNEIISRSESIECHSCGEKFKAANFYIQHHQSVHGNLPPEYLDKELFVCDQCPQVFITKISLSMHIYNGHNAENKLKKKEGKKCPYCEKSFQSYGNYLEHVKSKHEKKTPFHCDECDRSYATNGKLITHKQLVHQRVKCDECGKEICNTFILKRHKASVHGITPKDAYQCEKCPSFFHTRVSLEKHVKSKHVTY